jgi:hypothetical protein
LRQFFVVSGLGAGANFSFMWRSHVFRGDDRHRAANYADAAHLMHVLIERPSIGLGHRLAGAKPVKSQ